MDLKSLLNKEQYEGAVTVEGQVLILAGAGSGKTRVLTYRIAHMIEDLEIKPWSILAITFTNKAAKEMKERVESLVGEKANDMWISTFHSTCVRILRREIDKLGYKSSFTIYDTSDQKTLLKECMKALNINDKDITLQEIMGKIGRAKDNMQGPASFMREHESNFREKKIADVYEMYQKRLKENNALDFDDLIFKTVELFKSHEDVLEFYQNKFKYIMVDEYQDTNGAQYEFVRLLAKRYKNICVVGDDDQCIYAWRGADVTNILEFERDYPNCKVIKLEQNYRSKGNILEAANVVIVNNSRRKSKALRTEQDPGSKIKIYRAYSDKEEGDFVARQILDIKSKSGAENKDFAVLYRTNAQSRLFEEIFRRRGIPYKIVGGTKFYDRKEIKDMLAYLKVLVNPQDDISIKRIINVPKRSIGDATVNKVQDFADSYELNLWDVLQEVRSIPTLTARNCTSLEKFTELMDNFMIMAETMPVSVLIETILKDTGYLDELKKSNEIEDKSRIENLQELVSDAVEFEKSEEEDKSLTAYLEKVSLVQDIDNEDEEENSVVLMTLHSAKGLEFPHVFMVGMENGIFPSMSDFDKEDQMEEARRLCYVGITRAKETLYMTSAEVRRVFGRTMSYSQSDFIGEIKSDLKEYVNERSTNGAAREGMFNSPSKSSFNNPHSLRNSMRENNSNRAVSPSGISHVSPNNAKVMIDSSEITLGRKVKHPKFGEGTIVSIAPSESDKKLTIAFDKQGVKVLLLSMANLEVL
ncbi:DNA helicase-2/ATP-dependent DNA helicase PcrA [Clostridium moniliforme]|uniref:ATP-dependent DNA helicase n=1 Tax=Clostridium moniliforme TaxID=39489 RepID=A0ABS4F3Q4_9CLOT|nr:DNA helicase PcrA [Clostridium moniliforme]MBP1890732.1 DNA helicase-2/ATP-dependent DNA helicase PcrA [Clostridium moniliforme]